MKKELDWKADYEQLLMKATEYSGSKQVGQRKISASSLGKENYMLMVQYNFEKEQQEKFGANTIGSIFQLGVDYAIEKNDTENRYVTAKRLELELPNGWIVSGEYDVYDKFTNTIIDNKVISDYSYKEVTKNLIDSDYNLQVATYSMLDQKLKSEEQLKDGTVNAEPANGALAIINKGGSAVKDNIFTLQDLFMHDADTMYQMFIDKTNELQVYIDSNTMPEQTCDTAKFGFDKGVPKRCMLYCDYRDVCPNYNKNRHMTDRNIAKGLFATPVKQAEQYIKPMEF